MSGLCARAGALAVTLAHVVAAGAAAQPPAILDAGVDRVSLGPSVTVWPDPHGLLTAADVAARQPADSSPSLAPIRWLRVAIASAAGAPDTWVLEVGSTTADEVDAYVVAAESGPATTPSPLVRLSPGPRSSFQLTLPDHDTRLLLIRVVDFTSNDDAPTVWAPRAFVRQSRAEWLMLGLFYGAVLAMIGYNLGVLLLIRERPHFFFVAFATLLTASSFVWDGLGREMLWPSSPGLNRASLVVTDALAAIGGVWFTRSYLETATRAPRLDMAMLVLAGVSLVAATLSVGPTWGLAYLTMDVVSIAGPILLLFSAWTCARQGYRPALYFLSATAVPLIGISLESALANVMTDPPAWVEGGTSAGTLLMVLIFSLGLSERYNEGVRAQERLRAENQVLQTYSYRDALTGIANRRAFDEHLASEWRRAVREGYELSLILLDVDHFKRYNDRYGHQAGDECLRQVALAVHGVLRRPGDLAARVGGEEFAAVLVSASAPGAADVAEAVRTAVERLQIPHADSAAAPHVTVSVGVATAQAAAGTSAAALFEAADGALYAAKGAGRNRVATIPMLSTGST
jgi:diguanylate cyclase (GGDEF)-like protein